MHVKRTQITYRERVGVYPGDSGSDSKHPYLQVSSGFRATVIKFAFEVSLVSLPEINNNNNVIAVKYLNYAHPKCKHS